MPHAGFGILRRWAAVRPHGAFVFTSNVDGQFQTAGFPDARVCEAHGSLHHLQCLDARGDDIWPADSFEPEVDERRCALISEEPRCPHLREESRRDHLMPPHHIAVQVVSGRAPEPILRRLREARDRALLVSSLTPEWLASKGVKPVEELEFALRYVPTVMCGEDWWSAPEERSRGPECGLLDEREESRI